MAAESKTPWTEAPWIVCEHGDYGDYDGNCRVILGEGGDRRIAIVLGPDDAETAATATVMAKAPELVEALEPFAALLQDHNSEGPDSQPIFGINDATITRGHLRKARALLQQIRGEA